MHERLSFYTDCKTRDRNYGLWASDRNIVNPGRPATNTRQNNNGNRRGLECPEERDYYPYWHPTMWVDVAILTHNTEWCKFYQENSENVLARGHCKQPGGAGAAQNNKADCASPNEWVEEWSFGHPKEGDSTVVLPPPECVQAPWSRDNHLGSGLQGFQNSFNWTLPNRDQQPCINDDNCACVFRIRYNISTTDLDMGTGEESDKKTAGPLNSGNQPEVVLDWTKNDPNSPVTQDPTVSFDDVMVKLAIDTTQFGRTFQDRTHVFHIKKRPDGMPLTSRIYNLNVRGKRGNIVQTYPATEYDFVPQNLDVRVGDVVHFQWTGCDTNPAGAAGEGTAQTDRSNIVQLSTNDVQAAGYSYPVSDDWMEANPDKVMFPDKELRQYMAYGDQDPDKCEDYQSILARNNNNAGNADADPENCYKLNKMSAHFDAGLVVMNSTGEFTYMSSRNNNFSNRGQKGALNVNPVLPVWAIVMIIIGAVLGLGSAGVAGSMFYARSHPHSGVASLMNRIS
jgi:hypothetical protein